MITNGPLAGGSFVIEIVDPVWPLDNPGTPENERWDYILANHFVYSTTGDPHWTGHFPLYGGLLPIVEFRFANGGEDQIGGIIKYLVITIVDSDEDGHVDQDELGTQAVAANFECHKEQGGGGYEDYCGNGSGNGTLENFDPGMDDILTLSGTLWMRNFSCAVPVTESTWGTVKTLYE
jgi:hypothetical protein